MPADNFPEMVLGPIGVVKNGATTQEDRRWEDMLSEIVVRDEFAAGLDGIELFSHIIIVYWMHRLKAGERSLLKVHPWRKEEMPLMGVFATRYPARPNPVGLTVVRLLGRQGNTLKVIGLDAVDGTPVIDMKPYLLNGDCVPGATAPRWVAQGQGLLE